MFKIVRNVQNLTAVLRSVCVYVWNPILKAQNVYTAFIPFFSLFSGIGQNWVKLLLFLQNYLYQFYLALFAIVVIIN